MCICFLALKFVWGPWFSIPYLTWKLFLYDDQPYPLTFTNIFSVQKFRGGIWGFSGFRRGFRRGIGYPDRVLAWNFFTLQVRTTMAPPRHTASFEKPFGPKVSKAHSLEGQPPRKRETLGSNPSRDKILLQSTIYPRHTGYPSGKLDFC